MVNAMSDAVTGNYAMFKRKTFQTFFDEACKFSTKYREIPDLNFQPRSIARMVSAQAHERMDYLKQALNDALRKQRELLHEGSDLHERIVVTAFMDHCRIKELKKKFGCVSMIIRIGSHFFSIPIYIFDVHENEVAGEDANANAYHYHEALQKVFDPENIQFIGSCYDGAIFDKKKEGFIRNLRQHGLLLVDKLASTCNTHGHGLTTSLSATRIMKDFGLKYDGQDLKQPDPERRAPDCIWFKHEKKKFEKSFKTFNTMLKTLAVGKSTKKSVTFADFIYFLACEDYKTRKESGHNPQRTNSIFLRWKQHYFKDCDTVQEKRTPVRMVKENDKKLRRYYIRCEKLLDNIVYAIIAMKRKEFKEFFEEIQDPEIDEVFQHYMSQWCALVKKLWSINDSSKQGYNCSLLRSLLIVLKATTEQNDQYSPLSNVLLR